MGLTLHTHPCPPVPPLARPLEAWLWRFTRRVRRDRDVPRTPSTWPPCEHSQRPSQDCPVPSTGYGCSYEAMCVGPNRGLRMDTPPDREHGLSRTTCLPQASVSE